MIDENVQTLSHLWSFQMRFFDHKFPWKTKQNASVKKKENNGIEWCKNIDVMASYTRRNESAKDEKNSYEKYCQKRSTGSLRV